MQNIAGIIITCIIFLYPSFLFFCVWTLYPLFITCHLPWYNRNLKPTGNLQVTEIGRSESEANIRVNY